MYIENQGFVDQDCSRYSFSIMQILDAWNLDKLVSSIQIIAGPLFHMTKQTTQIRDRYSDAIQVQDKQGFSF